MNKLNKTTLKLFLFILITALIPLFIFTIVNVMRVGSEAVNLIINSNTNITEQIRDRTEEYLSYNQKILISLAQIFAENSLSSEQQRQILLNYSTNFSEFNYLRIIGRDANIKATSEIITSKESYENDTSYKDAISNKIVWSPLYMSKNLIPTIRVYIPIMHDNLVSDVLVNELDLLHLWKYIQQIKIGTNGYISITTSDGTLFASGDGSLKMNAINLDSYPYFSSITNTHSNHIETNDLLINWQQMAQSPNWYIIAHQPLNDAYAPRNNLIKSLIIITITFVLIIFFISWFLGGKYVVQPITTLIKHIKNISQGDLQSKVIINSGYEFKILGNTLNEMSDQILQREQQIIQKETQAVLGRLAKGLAHDIKHPFTTIEMFTNVLPEKYNDKEYINTYVQVVRNEFSNIHIFLENLAQLSQEISYNPIKMNLSDFIIRYVNKIKLNADKNKIVLSSQVAANIYAFIDTFNFQRALNNVCRNAIEAMPQGGTLNIQVSQIIKNDKLYACIKISDSGIGIPQEQLDKLFNNYASTKKRGLGIGLSMVQRIIAQHGGFIEVESTLEIGTSFYIFLPNTIK